MPTDIGLRYFTNAELACKESGKLVLAPGFGEWLDDIREQWGQPLKITSCCRSLVYNAKVGGRPNSYHIYNHPDRDFGTCAADIAITAGMERRAFIEMLLKNFDDCSIGVNSKFIHIDRRTHYDGSGEVLFTY